MFKPNKTVKTLPVSEEAEIEEDAEEEIEEENEDEAEEEIEEEKKSKETPKKIKQKSEQEKPQLNLTAEEVISAIEFNLSRAHQLLQLLK